MDIIVTDLFWWGLGVGGSEGPEMTKGRFRNSFMPFLVKGKFWGQSRRIFLKGAKRGPKSRKNFFQRNVTRPIKIISGMC